MQKNILRYIFLLFLVFNISCSKKIRIEGYNNGYKSGYEQGKIVGKKEGVEIGKNIAFSELIREYYNRENIKGSVSFKNINNNEDKLNYNEILPSFNINKEIDQDFTNSLFKIHSVIISEFASQLNLTKSQETELISFYTELHPIVAREYGKEFVNFKKIKALNRDPNNYIEFNNYNNAEIISKVISSNICSLFGLLSSAFLKKIPEIALAGFYAGGYCESLISGVVFPITNKLIEKGYIQDLEYSKVSIQNLGMEMIAELATVEAKYKITMNRERVIELLGLEWLKSVANINVSYVGITKAGFNLKDNFEVEFDHKNHLMIITLDEPKIFPPTVYSEINFMENGWFAKIDAEMINRMNSDAVLKITEKALNDKILESATQSGKSILESMFNPALQIPPKPYSIKVQIAKKVEK